VVLAPPPLAFERAVRAAGAVEHVELCDVLALLTFMVRRGSTVRVRQRAS
jgi:hypothetical protein